MESITVYLIGILCFAFGMVIGGLVFARFMPDQQKNRDLEKHLHETQDELKSYQTEVTQHFGDTAHLLRQLAESYRDVHNHLAQGAQELTSQTDSTMINKLPEIETIKEAEGDTDVTQPLDYAPKSTPFDRGTLDEEYGLEKVQLGEAPVENLADVLAQTADTQKEQA